MKIRKVIWPHDLWKEFGGAEMDRGYSCSPLAYKNTVIVTVGGAGQAVMAFDQKSGSVVQMLALNPQRDGYSLRNRIGVQLQTSALQERLKVWEAFDLPKPCC